MELRSSRLTRAGAARLAQAMHESGESTTHRHKPNLAVGAIDVAISRQVQSNEGKSDMAPGTTLLKKKILFTANHTSLNSAARKFTKLQSDRTRDSSPNRTPNNIVGQSNEPEDAAPTKSSGRQAQKQSDGHQTQTPSPVLQSNKTQATSPTKSAGRQALKQSDGHQTQTPSPEVQSNELQPAAPSKSSGGKALRQSDGHHTQTPGHPTKSTVNQAPANQSQRIAPTLSTGRQAQKKSGGQQTQSTNPPIIPPGNNKQSSSPGTPSTVHQIMPRSPPGKSVLYHPNVVKPAVLQNDETDHSSEETTDNNQDASLGESNETVDDSSSNPKRKRGPTMGKGLMKAVGGLNGKRLKVEVDPVVGRPKNRVQSAKFSSEIGVVTRDVLPIPRRWKEVDVKTALDPAFDHMQIHMDLNLDKPGVRESLIERFKDSSRQQRHRMHLHFKKFANPHEAKKNKPAAVATQEQWETLCDYFDSPQFKNQSQANSKNRQKMQSKHATGRTPFIIIQEEISRKNGKQCEMIELYKSTHQNAEGKWSSPAAKDNWERMVDLQETYADDMTEEEIVAEVLGTATAYVKGLGYGPKPPGKRNIHLQQLHETRAELEAAKADNADTRAELDAAKSDNAAYKSKVDAMTEQLSQQATQIAKLMAFMDAGGRRSFDENGDSD